MLHLPLFPPPISVKVKWECPGNGQLGRLQVYIPEVGLGQG